MPSSAAPPGAAAGPPSPPGRRRALWINSLFVDHAALRLGWRNWAAVGEGRL
ncbi:MAG: protein tyrosine phosphatase, partial [Acetobacteraceae bacterium]|nr:protein tyrosine phosphatase [Acetobacteraceae bacterium]